MSSYMFYAITAGIYTVYTFNAIRLLCCASWIFHSFHVYNQEWRSCYSREMDNAPLTRCNLYISKPLRGEYVNRAVKRSNDCLRHMMILARWRDQILLSRFHRESSIASFADDSPRFGSTDNEIAAPFRRGDAGTTRRDAREKIDLTNILLCSCNIAHCCNDRVSDLTKSCTKPWKPISFLQRVTRFQ